MTKTLRVVFEDETNPTFPDSWGWDDDETREYMEKVERGDYLVVSGHVQHQCETCGDWHDAWGLAFLGDIHVSADDVFPLDMNGRLRVVAEDDLPLGPYAVPKGRTAENVAWPRIASDNDLLSVAADLLAEARENADAL